MYEGVEITPPVAMLHSRLWALLARAPDAAQDRLEPKAVLIGGPQLHLVPQVDLLGMPATAQPGGHPGARFGPMQTSPFSGGCLRAAASPARWLADSRFMRLGVRCRQSSGPAALY
jgi:hypothetical protein